MLLVRGMSCTGEKCERSGLYLVNGICGHAAQRAVRRASVLPACPICGAQAGWTLLREFFTLAEDAGHDELYAAGPKL
jgi:hypothetical protein